MLKRHALLLIILLHVSLHAQDYGYSKHVNDSVISYNFYNKTHAPITLSIEKLSDLDIRIPDAPLVCPPMDSLQDIISIPKIYSTENEDFKASDHFSTSGAFGTQLNQKDIKKVLYELPFKSGKRYKVIQGYNGRLSHYTDKSRYAIDFKIPIGDTIVAARSGRVIRTVDHFTEHGGESYTDKANQILIYHDDGTIAFYVHLDTNGVLVNVGDMVKQGQPIGISGHTGYSTTPHLHFVVRNFRSAIPIQFKENGQIGKKSGRWAKKPKN
ncbi:M23 family metallopeptidase [Psychroserpens sp. MEBiC05023]